MSVLALTCLLLCWLCLSTGAVPLSAEEIVEGLGRPDHSPAALILWQSRIPLTLTALLAGTMLSLAGLILQTTFRNPLAGPTILGISSGASLGVALLMLGVTSPWVSAFFLHTGGRTVMLLAAMAGSFCVMALLWVLSSAIRSATLLLIGGIMLGYLASAIVALLNFFAPAETVKDFNIWGMGSFMGVSLTEIPLFASVAIVLCLLSLAFIKPLDAMLLGERYACSMGYNPKNTRTWLLMISGALTAAATAYCGPVGFIGLAVPHIARLVAGTSSHVRLLPATMLCGAATGVLCAWICVLPAEKGVLPLGAVTPMIGIPVIIYIILARRRLSYFS